MSKNLALGGLRPPPHQFLDNSMITTRQTTLEQLEDLLREAFSLAWRRQQTAFGESAAPFSRSLVLFGGRTC